MLKTILFKEQKSLLKKGPSIVPTPTMITWYEIRKDFTKSTNKIRLLTDLVQQQEFADLVQQQHQVHPQVNSNEPTIDENNVPLDKRPPMLNPYQQLYRFKRSTNNSVKLFIKSTEKELFNPIILNKLKTTSIKKKN